MPKVMDVVEYKDGIAIIEDTAGKFLAKASTGETTPLYDDALEAWMGRRQPCALLQSREAMLT